MQDEPTSSGRRGAAGSGDGHLQAYALTDERRAARKWIGGPQQTDFAYEGDNSWVLTYLDVMTLLLTLFVVLLAYAGSRAEEFEQLKGSLSAQVQGKTGEAVGTGKPGESGTQEGDAGTGNYRPDAIQLDMGGRVAPPLPPAIVPESGQGKGKGETEVAEEPARKLAERFQRELTEQGLQQDVDVLYSKGTVEFRVRDNILFDSGQAELRAQGLKLLDGLVILMSGVTSRVSVEGHTDNVPINTPRFPSNWELSAARATHVVRYLVERGMEPTRLRAIGYADTQPVADNATPQGQASNRRVSITMEWKDKAGGEAETPLMRVKRKRLKTLLLEQPEPQ